MSFCYAFLNHFDLTVITRSARGIHTDYGMVYCFI